jgi:hypothetical protein
MIIDLRVEKIDRWYRSYSAWGRVEGIDGVIFFAEPGWTKRQAVRRLAADLIEYLEQEGEL